MSLQAGSKLGPYEILAEAGIGGMGERKREQYGEAFLRVFREHGE